MITAFHVWFALVILCLLESMRVTKPWAVVFRQSIFGRDWQAGDPFAYPGGDRWGWTLLSLTPRTDPVIVSQQVAFSASTQASPKNVLEQLAEKTRILKALTTILWVIGFILFPALLATINPDFALVMALGLFWTVAIVIACAAFFADRRIARPPGRFPWRVLKYSLYPVSALRAVDDLLLGLFDELHPMELAMSLCAEEQQVALARRLLRCESGTRTATPLEAYLAKVLPQALVEEAPEPLDATCLSYCPRCRAQYRSSQGTCGDCPDMALLPLRGEKGRLRGAVPAKAG